MRVAELFKFIKARHDIWVARDAGKPKPWTKDPILQSYRFCNVYRELDKVTKHIALTWRDTNADQADLWFAMVVARKINWPASLVEIGYPVPWKRGIFEGAMAHRALRGEQLEGGAYMITAGVGEKWKGVPKYKFLAGEVFTPMWNKRAEIRPREGDTLAAFHARLMEHGNTVGSFIAAQIVADMKYVKPLKNASDWWTWAAPGPGSERGLNRVFTRGVDEKWNPKLWLDILTELRMKIDPLIKKAGMPFLHAQDLQNCLCEFDKYERVRLGEGKPRSKYQGAK